MDRTTGMETDRGRGRGGWGWLGLLGLLGLLGMRRGNTSYYDRGTTMTGGPSAR